LTKRCNAACDYCYVSDNTSRDLSTDKVIEIIDKLADAGLMHLNLTGGEPFMREDLTAILDHIIKRNFWKTSIYTNGTLITDRHIDYIRKNRQYISLVQFSVYSHIPEVHDAYVGIPGAFEKILDTSRRLRDAGVFVPMAFNILDINHTAIGDTVRFFKEHGYTIRCGFNKIINSRKSGDRNQNLQRLQQATSFDFYCDLLSAVTPEFLENEKINYRKQLKNTAPEDILLCRGIIYSIYIDAEGYLKPCSSFRNLQVGNIFEKGSLHDIVNRSDELKKLKALRRADLQPCRTCSHIAMCNICIGAVHTETGQLKHPSDQFCAYAKAVEYV